MNTLTSTPNVSFLLNQALIQICFGENELILNFDSNKKEGVRITIFSTIEINYSGRQVVNDNYQALASTVLQLLGKTVTSVNVSEEKELNIKFKDNSEISILSDVKGFESYTVKSKDTCIVV